jgi:nitrate reductase molybdenum cofactor assembly chaperone NarJ/NarW
VAAPLGEVGEHRAGTDPVRLASEYVAVFDLRRRCALHLTYYTHGDTRARGQALAAFAAAYRGVGLAVDGGELPDCLPAVLDLAAAHDNGWRMLREHRVGLDLLQSALEREESVYAHALRAVRQLLPPPGLLPAVVAASDHGLRPQSREDRAGLRPGRASPVTQCKCGRTAPCRRRRGVLRP